MRLTVRQLIPIIVLLLLPFRMMGQGAGSTLVLSLESVGMTGSGDYAPFWHTSNRQGLPSVESSNGYAHLTAIGGLAGPGGLRLGYGVDMGVGAGLQDNLFLHQLYADVDYKWLGMSVGMKERWGEQKNHRLSSGGLTWSGNSRPVPQIRLGIPDYTRVPILGNWFSVKGHIGYGRFTDDKWRRDQAASAITTDRYTDGILLHTKDAFVKFGDLERFPLEATLGLEMYCVFGGAMHNRELYYGDIYQKYELPSGPKAYLTALLPVNAVGEQGKENGNSLGSWHLFLNYVGREWGARAYYEHFFEDHSSMLGIEYKNDVNGQKEFVFYGFRRNWFDGLFGLEVTLPDGLSVRNVVLELLNTRGQCGPIYRAPVYPVMEGVDGRDGMYTHELYDSYSMHGYAIGNPLLLSPVYNRDFNQRFVSNRVLMYHVGVEGGIGSHFDYRTLLTSTCHWGTYEDPFNKTKRITSCMIEGTYLSGDTYGWNFGLSLGFDLDSGDMLGNNTGVMLTVSKSWKVL